MARLIVGGVYKRNLELLLVQMTEPRRKLHGQKFNTIIRFNRRLPKLSDKWAEDSDSAGGREKENKLKYNTHLFCNLSHTS